MEKRNADTIDLRFMRFPTFQRARPMDGIKADRLSLTYNTAPARRDDRFWENALRLSAQRLELIASNIANADTPNFKAREIDFKKALLQSLAVTATGLGTPSQNPPIEEKPFLAKPLYRTVVQPGVDNNTVDMDVERAAFAHSALMYEFTLQKAIGEYKDMAELFQSLT
ncbi:flagellar basal body rod protein FlgB [Oxalobacteraceae bacterium R-40]|uniref:Flagellar basal body rod protein FlgB n=1 Tax=Keguizhuia sedimenti TaxID=3064264 RepID=A0ABU1BTQ9_9BURK|nr:flagellar basal body rod protein FlgB [Oxalobacteraceae bacterium R-40]